MKFSEKIGNGSMNDWLHFSGDPDHRLDTGIVFQISHYFGSYGKCYQPTALRDAAVQGTGHAL